MRPISTEAPVFSRRAALQSLACGFGSVAFQSLVAEQTLAGQPHFAPRIKRVIFLFMQGGPSHVDTFDHKPVLLKKDGGQIELQDDRAIANSGMVQDSQQRLMGPRWKYAQHGQSGLWGTDLLPEMCRLMDDFCVINSMHTTGIAHGPATLFLHCGASNQIRPSMGSWINYGLGSANENLPAFVTICPSAGNGGARNYGSGFLPAIYQGTPIGKAGPGELDDEPIDHSSNPLRDASRQRLMYELARRQYRLQMASDPTEQSLCSELESMELAWRMQRAFPDVMDVSGESEETLKMYGMDRKETSAYGKKCLLARRLAEAGVRYIQVSYGDNSANPAWDQHSNLEHHEKHARATDKPVAGLIRDLKQRGMLEDTLVWWGGEFGRTPYAQNNGTGRDHNAGGFTVLLAGGGLKKGICHGSTDELGHKSIENRVHMHDLHATILHLLGLDHERLTYRHAGRDFRLTDVHGRVVREILA
jgi:hypothetical protein